VWLHDETGELSPIDAGAALWGDTRFQLWVPSLDAWSIDTLRMILHELSAYVPIATDTVAGITARLRKPRGRPSKSADRPRPRLDDVELWVRARGWSAVLETHHNARTVKRDDGQVVNGQYPTGDWSDPMVATLLDLAQKSPFPLSAITPVFPADPTTSELRLRYSPRLTVQRGIHVPAERDDDSDATAWADFLRRVRRRLDQLNNDDDEAK
jgi:hypothetical protein